MLEFSPFLWRTLPFETRREFPEFFPEQAAKLSLILSYESETGLLWMWPGPSCFLSSGDGYVGNFLSCSKGVNDPLDFPGLDVIILETPQRKWASSILEVRTSWIFSSCGRCSRLITVTKGTDSGGLMTGQSPFEFFGGFWGFLSL